MNDKFVTITKKYSDTKLDNQEYYIFDTHLGYKLCPSIESFRVEKARELCGNFSIDFYTDENDDKVYLVDKPARKMKDYDRWFKPCVKCGFDPGRVGKDSKNRCWKCGGIVYRDYSERALKENKHD